MPLNKLITNYDMMGRIVKISNPPRRIISLVPSQTEFLLAIGAPVVGRTKFCIHPQNEVEDIPIIGGTKKFRFDEIRKLKPDLIIGNKEENYKEGIEVLEKEFPVWMSDIFNLDDAYKMMTSLGDICDLRAKSDQIVNACKDSLDAVKGSKSGKVIYFIWKKPWMVAGKNTFIDHLLSHLGYENLIKMERYPEMSSEEIAKLNPDTLLFSSEPFPFNEQHLREAHSLWPQAQCQLVDGELYSWYGCRLKEWGKEE